MDLNKIKKGADVNIKNTNILLAIKLAEGYALLDKNFDFYRIIVDDINGKYYCENKNGESFGIARNLNRNNVYVITPEKGNSYGVEIEDEIDPYYLLDNDEAVRRSVLLYLAGENKTEINETIINEEIEKGLIIDNGLKFDYDGEAHKTYALSNIGKDFLVVSMKNLSKNAYDRIVIKSGLIKKPLNDEKVIVKVTAWPSLKTPKYIYQTKKLEGEEREEASKNFEDVFISFGKTDETGKKQ